MSEVLTHFDAAGNAVMVDVTAKADTVRTARAEGTIRLSPAAMQAVLEGSAEKGDVLGVARVAGILGVKQTPSLIPLCHPLNLGRVSVDFRVDEEACEITAVCTAKVVGKTGVEMEALTGVSVALLTVYDMLKAIDKDMEISGIHLLEKDGGKSGRYLRNAGDRP
jgi:cyclic pyranopterin phosphate synthase